MNRVKSEMKRKQTERYLAGGQFSLWLTSPGVLMWLCTIKRKKEVQHHTIYSAGLLFFEVSDFLLWIPINGDTSINLLYYLKLKAIKEMILKYHSQLTETLASHILQC